MASVTAIEQRDPTTSGHSFRVATLTTGLAEVVARCEEPRFKGVSFDADQMKEIRYAALLHDFGKVGVREEVLVKGKKLYPAHLDLVKQRYAYIKAWIEAESLRRLFDHLKREGVPDRARLEESLAEVTRQVQAEIASVDEGLATVIASNEPTVLPEGNFEAIVRLGARTYRDLDGDRNTDRNRHRHPDRDTDSDAYALAHRDAATIQHADTDPDAHAGRLHRRLRWRRRG